MQTGENYTEENSLDLNRSYVWFDEKFRNILTDTIKEFWGENAEVKLISVSENTNILTKGEEYFVTQIRLNKELSFFIRLSKGFVKNVLDTVLGPCERVFDISKLSELEVKILTGFDNFLFKNFSKIIKKDDELPENTYVFDEYNLVFMVQVRNQSLGKIVIKIPVSAVEPTSVISPEQPCLDINDFLKTKVDVNLFAGYSRIKLSDLKNLEKDDIVLLENSKSSKMILKFNNKKIEFNVAPNPAIMTDYEIDENTTNSEGGFNMNSDMYNMWDTIQVEIGAEFEKVKLSLGELKQISEGLIVDIGSVYDNKIDLKVDNNIVASGELVIINDRYGVKINEIYTEEKDEHVSQQEPVYEEEYEEEPSYEQEYDESQVYGQDDDEIRYEQNQGVPMDESNSEVNDEDFDYSEFDVDEENL